MIIITTSAILFLLLSGDKADALNKIFKMQMKNYNIS